MQKLLWLTTEENGVRDKVIGWSYENGDAVKQAWQDRFHNKIFSNPENWYHPNDMPVGAVRSEGAYSYPTVLHAIGDGWKLLAIPEKIEYDDQGGHYIEYCWWLTKD